MLRCPHHRILSGGNKQDPHREIRVLKTVLITGASTGLGLAIARRLLRDPSYQLILTARESSLKRFAEAGLTESNSCIIRVLDVMDADQRKSVVDEIESRWGALDVLINNAGFAFRSVLEHVEQADLWQQMNTNFWGPIEIARLALPRMRARREGKIINVSSVGGMMAMPTMAVYSASKFALEGASESLYYELKPWGVNVTLIEPGFINSGSFENVRYTTLSGDALRDPSEPYYGHYRFMAAFIRRVMRRSPTTPQAVAEKIARVVSQKNPPLRVAATPDAVLFDLMRRYLPRGFYHWLLYKNLPHADCWGDELKLRKRCGMEIASLDQEPGPK